MDDRSSAPNRMNEITSNVTEQASQRNRTEERNRRVDAVLNRIQTQMQRNRSYSRILSRERRMTERGLLMEEERLRMLSQLENEPIEPTSALERRRKPWIIVKRPFRNTKIY